MLRKLLLCTTLLFVQPVCHAQSFSASSPIARAEEIYETLISNPDSLRNLTFLAETNNPYATFYLGVAHETGRGVAKNPDTALQYFSAAADKVHEAAFNAGRLHYLAGQIDQAMSYLLLAAGGDKADGMTQAMVLIARIYEKGESSAGKNYVAAGRWYEIAARRKDAEATGKIGEFSLYGLGRPINTKDGRIYLERAAGQWVASAQHLLGEMYAKGIGTPVSRTDAAKWFFIEASFVHDPAPKSLVTIVGLTDLERTSGKKMAEIWAEGRPKLPVVNYLALVEKVR